MSVYQNVESSKEIETMINQNINISRGRITNLDMSIIEWIIHTCNRTFYEYYYYFLKVYNVLHIGCSKLFNLVIK